MKKYILHIFVSLLLSICLSLFVLQQNTKLKNFIQTSILSALEKEWDAKIAVQGCHLNVFTASIVFENGTIKPNKQSGTVWGFAHAKTAFGIWDALTKKKISLYLTFYNVHGTTLATEKEIGLISHIKDILTSKNPDIPISIKQVHIREGNLNLEYKDLKFSVAIHGSFSYGKKIQEGKDIYQGCILLNNSSILLNQKMLISGINGSNIFFRKKRELFWQTSLHNTFQSPDFLTKNIEFSLTGLFNEKEKSLYLKSNTNHLDLACSINENFDTRLEGTIPLQLAAFIGHKIDVCPYSFAKNIQGLCRLNLAFENHPTNKFACRGSLKITDPFYKNSLGKELVFKNLYYNTEIASTDLILQYNDILSAQGSALWNFATKQGTISVANAKEVIMLQKTGSPIYWGIQPQEASVSLNFNETLKTSGTYSAKINNSTNQETREITGNINLSPEQFEINGTTLQYNYLIKGLLGSHPVLTDIFCNDETSTKDPLICFSSADTANRKKIVGYAKYNLIQAILPRTVKDKILGKNNKVFLELDQEQLPILSGKIWFTKSRFFIPSMQNTLKEGVSQFTVNLQDRKIELHKTNLKFARGNLYAPFTTCTLNHKDFSLESLYMPISTNNLLLNLHRDFYSFVYGNVLFQKQQERPISCSGTIVLQKTLIRGDIFNDSAKQVANANPLEKMNELKELDFSLRFINEKPIIIKTPTIEALAHVDLQANYRGNQKIAQLPHVTGTVNIDNGYLKFLHNTLKIEYGKIQFLTRQLEDPIIDVIAKNRINKYVVTLQVTGSLQKPTVILESTPELSEEQILGLLFSGSENVSLQTDLPVMIMQNLNTILLGHKKPYDRTSMILDTLSKPLKYVQITPDFADSSGKNSVKAQISVPLTKQLKAQFQKNLTFDDEINVEIDYFLSDEINLKLVKDQRGELGSEVEVRLKF